MASPAFRAAGAVLQQTTTGGSDSGNVSLPAGTADGDFLLLIIRTLVGDSLPVPPSGWTAIDSFETTSPYQTDLHIYRRTAASEPASYVVSNSGNGAGSNQFFAQILGWDSGIFDTSAKWVGSSSNTTIQCPSVTAADSNSTLICVYGQQGNNSNAGPYTPPSGMTEREDVADTSSVGQRTSYGAADLSVGAGATGTKNATATDGTTYHCGVSLIIYNSIQGLSGQAILSGITADGGMATQPDSSLSGQAILSGITADGGMGLAPGVLTTPVLKNNTGTILASVSGIVANVYNSTTGALVVRKTGLTSNGSGIVTISDVLLAAGTTYAYELDLSASSQGRRLPTGVAA